ncbi:MAG: hypothetical protein JST92_27630 [Deltaproteobacteria bacterium]|nr:hypothetical protein [Deltaproteobacteria bacterium]
MAAVREVLLSYPEVQKALVQLERSVLRAAEDFALKTIKSHLPGPVAAAVDLAEPLINKVEQMAEDAIADEIEGAAADTQLATARADATASVEAVAERAAAAMLKKASTNGPPPTLTDAQLAAQQVTETKAAAAAERPAIAGRTIVRPAGR